MEAKKFVYTKDIENEDKEERVKIRNEKLNSDEWVLSYKVPEEHKAFMRERFREGSS